MALLSDDYAGIVGTITSSFTTNDSSNITYWYDMASGGYITPTKSKKKKAAPVTVVSDDLVAWLRGRVDEVCWRA